MHEREEISWNPLTRRDHLTRLLLVKCARLFTINKKSSSTAANIEPRREKKGEFLKFYRSLYQSDKVSKIVENETTREAKEWIKHQKTDVPVVRSSKDNSHEREIWISKEMEKNNNSEVFEIIHQVKREREKISLISLFWRINFEWWSSINFIC